MEISVQISKDFKQDEVIDLYRANGWSSADVPEKLVPALLNSDTLILARIRGQLVGLGNAISDGHLVVYYPHMLVHPEFHGLGVGRMMMDIMLSKYGSFHQQMLTADGEAVDFYKAMGFERAGKTEPMWVYSGDDH